MPPLKRARLINRLREGQGGIVTHAELIEALWGDDRSGGPIDIMNSLNALITKMRRMGFPIRCAGWRGYRYAANGMIPIGNVVLDAAMPIGRLILGDSRAKRCNIRADGANRDGSTMMKGKSSGMGGTQGTISLHGGLTNKAPKFMDKSGKNSGTSVNADAVRSGVQPNQKTLGPRSA